MIELNKDSSSKIKEKDKEREVLEETRSCEIVDNLNDDDYHILLLDLRTVTKLPKVLITKYINTHLC